MKAYNYSSDSHPSGVGRVMGDQDSARGSSVKKGAPHHFWVLLQIRFPYAISALLTIRASTRWIATPRTPFYRSVGGTDRA